MPSGETLEAAYVYATATIGEKISFRRFALLEKTDVQHFGAYQHNGGRIGVISVVVSIFLIHCLFQLYFI